MKRVAVVYASKYGSTRIYAEWIAQALSADLLEHKLAAPERLAQYDLVVFGGGMYAGSVAGIKTVTAHPPKRLVVFAVGLAMPSEAEAQKVAQRNLTKQIQGTTRLFLLRGGIDHSQLSPVHRVMMGAVNKLMLSRIPDDQLTEDLRGMKAGMGGKVDFCDKASIEPLLEYVNGLA